MMSRRRDYLEANRVYNQEILYAAATNDFSRLNARRKQNFAPKSGSPAAQDDAAVQPMTGKKDGGAISAPAASQPASTSSSVRPWIRVKSNVGYAEEGRSYFGGHFPPHADVKRDAQHLYDLIKMAEGQIHASRFLKVMVNGQEKRAIFARTSESELASLAEAVAAADPGHNYVLVHVPHLGSSHSDWVRLAIMKDGKSNICGNIWAVQRSDGAITRVSPSQSARDEFDQGYRDSGL